VLERLKAIARQRHAKGPHKGRRKIATANAHRPRRPHAVARQPHPRGAGHPCYVAQGGQPVGRPARPRAPPAAGAVDPRGPRPDHRRRAQARLGVDRLRHRDRMVDRPARGRHPRPAANFDPGALLEILQGKTAGHVSLPVGMVPEIAEAVEALRADQRARARRHQAAGRRAQRPAVGRAPLPQGLPGGPRLRRRGGAVVDPHRPAGLGRPRPAWVDRHLASSPSCGCATPS
jgi:hypothetical protein